MSEDRQPSPASEFPGPIEQNGWLVEEKYQQFLVNPAAVEESWRALFSNGWDRRSSAAYRNREAKVDAAAPITAPPAVPMPAARTLEDAPQIAPSGASNGAVSATVPAIGTNGAATNGASSNGASSNGAATNGAGSGSGTTESDAETITPLRGAPAKLAENMVVSLGVPTATSVHPLPAAVLEANRKLINAHLASSGRKVSFTHIIAFAIVRGLRAVPALNSTFVADVHGTGGLGVIHHEHVGLGLAIDLARRDGGRALVVPSILRADELDFLGLVDAYEDVVVRARDGKLTATDFAGVTVTITNPGTLGTTQSVPRLMSGQGAIIGVGAIDYPVEFAATDPGTLRSLGIGKVLTLTSTYDHRIIQGAESGLFLKHVHELLVGEHDFYDEIFSTIGLAAPPVRLGKDASSAPAPGSGIVDARVLALVDAYRTRGHVAASLDPLASVAPRFPSELDPTSHGFSVFDFDRAFETTGVLPGGPASLGTILDRLRAAYCGTIGAEFRHLPERVEREFFQARLEAPAAQPSSDQQRRTLDLVTRAEAFERFLQVRYPALKRFSLEGGESAIAFLDALLEHATANGVTEAIIGMAHRGRLNTLANIVGKPLSAILAEFEDNLDPLTVEGSGDVKYHKGGHGTWTGLSGRSLAATLAANPSHLEAVDPVVEGIARARQDALGPEGEQAVFPVLIHGDASMAGQGVVAETFNLSLVDGYRTGGTVHLVINNQIGFTTGYTDGRSTRYASDVAKMVDAPILHVNGDDPDAVVRCAGIAAEYRATFGKDIVVDLVCYRLHGHNEGDDPTYTQPAMYRTIASHPSVRTRYAELLADRGVVTAEGAAEVLAGVNAELAEALAITRATPHPHFDALPEKPFRPMPSLTEDTPVDKAQLDAIAALLHRAPEGFHLHPKLERQFGQRYEQYESGGEADWALGEAFAYATLLLEGTSIRLIGQDSRRGTFSHRHGTLFDYDTAAEYTPLASLAAGEVPGIAPPVPTWFELRDSVLSEYAGLGFEYGYTVGNPAPLVLWEAQFGDFANGAQIIFDNFISSSEEKWGQRSGVVLLLPHGYEGQGPEHSSARIERFLQLSNGENLSVVQPTTAAQFFHLIRAHAHLAERRPLVVITPKSLLRKRIARSKVEELCSGGFRTVIDDAPRGAAADVRRVVCCSGRLAEDLLDRRNQTELAGGAPIAVLRVEQLAPWPADDLAAALGRYPGVEEIVWAQDEPENMGALTYAVPRLAALAGSATVTGIARRAAGSPATGSHDFDLLERKATLDRAIGQVAE